MIQQCRKVEGTGKGNGKKGAWWNCSESDHYSKDCMNDVQTDGSWTDGGTLRNQKVSKAGKDAVKVCDTEVVGTGPGMAGHRSGRVSAGRTHGGSGAGQ